MYSIISNIISHAWQSSGAGDQQYIYITCAALIVILTTVMIDLCVDVIRSAFGGR